MRQTAQQLVAAVFEDDGLDDHRAEPGHALAKPGGHAAAMQRQVGAAGTPRHQRPSAVSDGRAGATSDAPNKGSGLAVSSTGAVKLDTVTPTNRMPVSGG